MNRFYYLKNEMRHNHKSHDRRLIFTPFIYTIIVCITLVLPSSISVFGFGCSASTSSTSSTNTKLFGLPQNSHKTNDEIVSFVSSPPPIVYTIAGSDSGGGAGIQADLHAIHSFGCHGCTAVTCLTAQNSMGVDSVYTPPIDFLQQQLRTLQNDLPPHAIKIGMLGTADLARTVGTFLKELRATTTTTTTSTVDEVTEHVWVVLDPVMISTSGHRLIETDTQQVMIDDVFPYVDIVTPNKFEAEALLKGRKIQSMTDVEKAARDILQLCPQLKSVLIKGGHTFHTDDSNQPDVLAQDYFLSRMSMTMSDDSTTTSFEPRICDCSQGTWIQSKRYDSEHTHGTGCTLSSSIAAALALGEQARRFKTGLMSIPTKETITPITNFKHRGGCWTSMDLVSACCLAKAYVTAGIHQGGPLGRGPGPVRQTHFPDSYEYFPSIIVNDYSIPLVEVPEIRKTKSGFLKLKGAKQRTQHSTSVNNDHSDPDIDDIPVLGSILPIVDSIEWIERLCQTNSITDIQLRIKNKVDLHEIKQLVQDAQIICQKHQVRLWLNDYWEIAIDVGVFGVHVGQEDLYECVRNNGIEKMKRANLAFGISTHSFSELAVAIGMEPSYISLGPIFATGSKQVNFDPQGTSTIELWRKLIPPSIPLCVIGGIGTPETVKQVRVAGADCVAVIGAVTQPTNTQLAVEKLKEAMVLN